MKKGVEEQIRSVLAKHSFPPLEVVIPILEKAGRGEEELTTQLYESNMSLVSELREILKLKDGKMRNLARMFEVLLSCYGQRFEPIELSDIRFSFSISDCPMLHVGKDVNASVRGKYCDLVCSAGAKAFTKAILGPDGTCSWDKALIKGAGKCQVIFEMGKTK